MILRTKSLVGRYVHVLSDDPALDQGAEDFEHRHKQAIETGNLDLLPLKNGERPLVWEFEHLSADATAWMFDRGRDGDHGRLMLHALALGLVGVRGLKDEAGQDARLTRRPDPKRGGFEAVVPDQLEQLVRDDQGHVLLTRISELGGRVVTELVPPQG